MKSKIHIIIKTIMVLFLLSYLVLLYTSNNAKNISMDEISSSLASDDGIKSLQKRTRMDLKRFYQIDSDTLEGFFFYKSSSPMSVDEIMIAKASSSSETALLLKNAQAHLNNQKRTFEGYGTDQTALLNQAIVSSRGKFVYYFCGTDSSKWYQKFLKLI